MHSVQKRPVCCIAGGGLVYDVQLVAAGGSMQLRPWREALPARIPLIMPQQRQGMLTIPTAQTLCFSDLLEACMESGRTMLLVGSAGVGKSTVLHSALQRLEAAPGSSDPGNADDSSSSSNSGGTPCNTRVAGNLLLHTLTFSASTGARDAQIMLEERLEKKHKMRYDANWLCEQALQPSSLLTTHTTPMNP
jgi:dynein heavy chain